MVISRAPKIEVFRDFHVEAEILINLKSLLWKGTIPATVFISRGNFSLLLLAEIISGLNSGFLTLQFPLQEECFSPAQP